MDLPLGTRLLLPSGKRGTITGWYEPGQQYEVLVDGHDDELDGYIRDLVKASEARPLPGPVEP